jgi:hypothetical protein
MLGAMARFAQQRFLLDLHCNEASFEVNSEPHTGARPSVRVYVGLKIWKIAFMAIARADRPNKQRAFKPSIYLAY